MKQHDFTKLNCRWGWNIVSILRHAHGDYEILGIGSGIEKGDCLMMTADDGKNCSMRITSIKYDTNPKDMFTATIDQRDIDYREPTQ